MKKLLIGLLALGSVSSFACVKDIINDVKVKHCVGDKVTSDSGEVTYTIKSINPYTKRFLITKRNYHSERKSIEELGVLEGCMQGLCVGDKVTSDRGDVTYTIKSINPYTKRFLITKRNYHFKRKSVEELGVLKGCMQGLCIGDKVTFGDSDVTYTIKSFNPYSERFLITKRNFHSERKKVEKLYVLSHSAGYDDETRYLDLILNK